AWTVETVCPNRETDHTSRVRRLALGCHQWPSADHGQGDTHVLDEVERWLERRSYAAADRPLDLLLAAKRAAGPAGTSSVVLPALNEEPTVGAIVEEIRRELMSGAVPLVDELVVLDSGSTDRTGEVAARAG